MKTIGMTLLIVGVAFCAMFGSRTTDTHSERLAVLGKAKLALGRYAKDHHGYCGQAAKLWDDAIKGGCSPLDATDSTMVKDPQRCVDVDVVTDLSLKDGCGTGKYVSAYIMRTVMAIWETAPSGAPSVFAVTTALEKKVKAFEARRKFSAHHPGYCSNVRTEWLKAMTEEGCHPLGKVLSASPKAATACTKDRSIKVRAMASWAMNQGCDLTVVFNEWTFPEATVAKFLVLGELVTQQSMAAQRRLKSSVYDGIYREARSAWTGVEDGQDFFLELSPNGDAIFYSVAHLGDARVVHARGKRTATPAQVVVNLCGVGQYIDMGCSRNVFQSTKGRLTLTSVSAEGGQTRRPARVRDFVLLSQSHALNNKYSDQRRNVARLRVLRKAGQALKLVPEIRQLREKWLASFEASIGPRSDVAGLQPAQLVGIEVQVEHKAESGSISVDGGATQPGGARLSAWFGRYGMGFMLGLVLLVAGGVISRRAIRAEAIAEPKEGQPQAVDFGDMLHETSLQVAAHGQEMASLTVPTEEDFARFKQFVEDTQLESIQRLVEAKDRIQVRYGIAVFAAIFGPLSKGERYLNRVWSALVDSHWPEATRSMRVAGQALTEAHAEILAVSGTDSSSPEEAA
jgi:hypothetical protein